MQLESLIMDDVANHLVKALDVKELKDLSQPPAFSCSGEEEPWAHGATFQRKILEVLLYWYSYSDWHTYCSHRLLDHSPLPLTESRAVFHQQEHFKLIMAIFI